VPFFFATPTHRQPLRKQPEFHSWTRGGTNDLIALPYMV